MSKQKETDIALRLLMHEGSVTWRRFNVFILMHSILLGYLSRISVMGGAVPSTIAWGGATLCIIWYFMNRRNFSQSGFYFNWAVRSLPRDEYPFLHDVSAFGRGEKVEFGLDGQKQTRELPKIY